MKRTALTLTLLLALCGGCAANVASGDGWWMVTVTVLKEPKFDQLRLTKAGVGVKDYDGISKATGADVAAIAGSAARRILGFP